MNRRAWRTLFFQVAIGIAFIAAWQIVGGWSSRNRFLYSTPYETFLTFYREIWSQAFWVDVGVTLAEAIGGYIVGNVTGLVVGLGLWRWPSIGAVMRPYVVALGSVPVFALVPLLILWCGVGFPAKIIIVALCTVFVTLAHAYDAAVQIGEANEELIRGFGGSRWELFGIIVFRGSVLECFSAFRLNVGFAFIGAYLAEWVSSQHGLGQYILKAISLYDVSRVWVGLVVFALLASGFYGLIVLIEKSVMPWKRSIARTSTS